MNEIQTQVIDSKAMTSLEYAKNLVITNDDHCREAIAYGDGLSALIKEIEDTFRPTLKKMDEARKGLYKEMTDRIEPVEEAKKLIKSKRIVYTEEQERIRKIEEARLQALARKQAEEAALAAAIAAEEAGEGAEAEAIINEPVHVPTVIIPKTTPSAGVSGAIRELWSAEVTDLRELLCSIIGDMKIVDRLVVNPYITVEANKSVLDGIARRLHDKMMVPGVKAVSRKV